MTIEPGFKNPNRQPVISLMDLARLNDVEQSEVYRDGYEGLPCGDNRSRSYWHGWRNGSRDGGHRAKNGDMWDSLFTRTVAPGGSIATLRQRVEECRKVLRDAGGIRAMRWRG